MTDLLVYLLLGVIAAIAQKRFFDSVAAHDRSVKSDDELAAELLNDPLGIVAAAGRELPRRFGALFRRQPTRQLEINRRLALAAIAMALVAFFWLVVKWNS